VALTHHQISSRRIAFSVLILLVLIFSKYFYLASMSSYFTFYLMDKFHVGVQSSQLHLFMFLFAVAAGTFLGDRLATSLEESM
jgi:FSR family fosmidomycin resistance protein-like MFS transporter